MPEIYVVVSLAFAVFAAVSAVGSAIVLGIGYERVRAGLDRVKEGLDVIGRQTGFFSTELYKLERRVDAIDQDVAVPEKTVARTKSKGRAKKTKLQTDLAGEVVHDDVGTISVPFVRAPSNDLRVYMSGMMNSEDGDLTEGKIRFM